MRNDDHLRHGEALEHDLHAIHLLLRETIGRLVEDEKVLGLNLPILLGNDLAEACTMRAETFAYLCDGDGNLKMKINGD